MSAVQVSSWMLLVVISILSFDCDVFQGRPLLCPVYSTPMPCHLVYSIIGSRVLFALDPAAASAKKLKPLLPLAQ